MGPVRQNSIQRTVRSVHMCVCIALCTIVAHNIARNRPDNFPSYPPDNHHCSDDAYLREGEGFTDRSSHLTSGSDFDSATTFGALPSSLFNAEHLKAKSHSAWLCAECLHNWRTWDDPSGKRQWTSIHSNSLHTLYHMYVKVCCSHSLANCDSCPTPAKSEGIEYLQSWPHRN